MEASMLRYILAVFFLGLPVLADAADQTQKALSPPTCTALHDAVSQGHADVVEILVKAGARLDIIGHDGKTALDLAKERRSKAILKLLEGLPRD
jgi:ankyrin repeat protein